MNGKRVYRIAEGVRVREENFGLLVISNSTPALALNPDLKRVWEMIDGVRSLDEVSNAISEEYDGADITSQIQEIYQRLLALNLIEPVS